jgi:hypothetical protein
MTTTLRLKLISENPTARLYETNKGLRQWIPREVCPRTLKRGDEHEVTIEDGWLEQNQFKQNKKI